MNDFGLYEGPRDGQGDDDHASRNWCGGIVASCARFPEHPLPTAYSRAVRRRITKGLKPKHSLAVILGWAKAA